MIESDDESFSVPAAASRIKSAAARDAREAARLLVDLADRATDDPELQARALGLRLDLEGGTAPDDIVQRLGELVDSVVSRYSAEGGADGVRRRNEIYARLRAELQRRAPGNEPAFRGEGLFKRFADSNFELGELDLTLRCGEITGVVGENAHGKTTLLRIVAGELKPDRGRVAYPLFGMEGPALDWLALKRDIAFVPQELPAWRGSLSDMLHYEAAMRGILGRDNEREVGFVVERLGLKAHLTQAWGELSGGYKLRFALARALVWKPRLLVLDEPLANLDVKAKSVLLQDVQDLARSYRYPIAVLLSSHDLHDIERVSQQMVFLRSGEVLYVGPAAAIASASTSNEYLLSTSMPVAVLAQKLRARRSRRFARTRST